LRHWFFLGLLAGLSLAWFFPQFVRPVTDRLEPRAVVALALFLMAASLNSRTLYQSLLKPLPALWAVVLSYGLLPSLGWLGGQLIASSDLRIGLLIIASVPCTLASAVLWTRMAGGNDAVAMLVVLLTTALSWLVTTAWLTFGTGTAVVLDAGTMMRGLALVLVLPVGLGQLSRLAAPLNQFFDGHKEPVSFLSRLLVLCIILRAAVDVRDRLEAYPAGLEPSTVLILLVLSLAVHLLTLTFGFWSSRSLGFARPNAIAVAFSCSQKTLPVALFLFDAYFVADYPLAALPLVVYHIGQLSVDTLIAERWARPKKESP
jgi:sodium/bile acid cotransporter 7